jgi:hypothetical protein
VGRVEATTLSRVMATEHDSVLIEEARLDGRRLGLRVRRPEAFWGNEQVTVVLWGHDRLESGWQASIPARQEADTLVAELDADPSWRVLELAALEVPSGRRIVAGTDFGREYLVLGDDSVVTGDAAAAAFQEVQVERQAFYDQPLGTEGNRYRAVLLAEGVLLSGPLQIPGMVVKPLSNSTRGADLAQIMNDVLAQLNLHTRVLPQLWVNEHRTRRPTLVFTADDVRAPDVRRAVQTVFEVAEDVLALLALQRDAAPALLAGIIESTDVDPPQGAGWIGLSPYRGNLMGGFISGESQAAFVSLHEGLHRDPRLRLWLSLHHDALAEERWDFRVFRHFNLLETISREMFGEGSAVVRFDGSPIIGGDGKPVTTSSARGKVYALLRWWSEVVSSAEGNLCAPGATSLWDEVGVWVGLRDAVAHDGGYRADSGLRIKSAKRVEPAFARLRAANPHLAPEWAYLRAIQEATKSVVGAFLCGRLISP